MDYMKDELILCINLSEEDVGVILIQVDHVVAYELKKQKFDEHNYLTTIENYSCLKFKGIYFGKAF